MKNQRIAIALMNTGVRKYELAKFMGISEATLGRMTREELPVERQEEIVRIIEEGAKRNESNVNS